MWVLMATLFDLRLACKHGKLISIKFNFVCGSLATIYWVL